MRDPTYLAKKTINYFRLQVILRARESKSLVEFFKNGISSFVCEVAKAYYHYIDIYLQPRKVTLTKK